MRKRFLTTAAVCTVLAFSLTACGNNTDNNATTAQTENVTTVAETTTAETVAETTATATENGAANVSGDFSLEKPLADIVEDIYSIADPGLRLVTTDVNLEDEWSLKSYTGLDLTSADKIDSAVASESMMGSQAYSLVLVRVKDAADAAQIAEEMNAGIDVRKWICVSADDKRVVACDDVVMLFMVDPEFADMITADKAVEAFSQICGKEFTADLK